MRLIQTNCEVIYKGRGETKLECGTRLIIIKDDNSIIIHQDKGIKPLNYMCHMPLFEEYIENGITCIHAESKNEELTIKMIDIGHDMQLDIDDGSELLRHGTEFQLQEWLCTGNNFENTFGSNIEFVTREYSTTKGKVDLLGKNKEDGQLVLIEIKRFAKRNDLFQLVRYKTALQELYEDACKAQLAEVKTTICKNAVTVTTDSLKNPHMILIAPKMKRGVCKDAERQNIRTIEIGNDWTKTINSNEKE